MPTKIAVIGECMIELSESKAGIVRHFGGDTLNTAVYLARTNPELAVHYVTALGTDAMSGDMLAQWQQEGVHIDLVQRFAHKLPGLYLIETDARGERTFHYWRNDAAARFWLQGKDAEQICRQLQHFDYLYLSGISLAILSPADRASLLQQLALCRAGGVKIAFDNNYRPRLWESMEAAQQAHGAVLALTDIAFLTLDDDFALWGESQLAEVVARTQAQGVTEIVIKRGAEPCLIMQGAHCCEVPAMALVREKVVDTTAAGDSFSAGYLASRLAGLPASEAAHHAHRLAGTVIQHRGAIIPLSAMPATVLSSNPEVSHVKPA